MRACLTSAAGLDRGELLTRALSLGADVPFQLSGGAALVGGVGDRLRHCWGIESWVAIAWSGVTCSTATVFGAVTEADFSRGDEVGGSVRRGGVGGHAQLLRAAAMRVYPALAAAEDALGSGMESPPDRLGRHLAFFQLCEDRAQADALVWSARALPMQAWVTRTIPSPSPAYSISR